ncbi:MAG TPA: bifunctional riboflavin kinase/FAD synthetase [Thermoanaerobaculia bacterium]|nr:bifunctional riboflavin kinase/FAD synthetase [Thermoanaerobaculia bacterium]
MLVVHDAYDGSDLPQGGVAAIGNFDGVHRGQRATLERTVARARELQVPSIVITFDPHPMSVLHPEQAPLAITTPEQKQRLLAEAGITVLLSVRFTREFARTSAPQFVRDFLVARLAVREVFVGESFTFGHRREGNLALLRTLGDQLGFKACGVAELVLRGERISSTRIRRAVLEGRVEDAAEMLGRPVAITGTVARGDRMGQRLGWPTINLAADHKLLPADGVYAGRVLFPSFPATFDCAINVGTRPTVYENYQRVVESHILDFKADVYGERVELSFHKRLREEKIFPSVMDLAAQIGRDVEATREYFARRRLEQDGQPAGL